MLVGFFDLFVVFVLALSWAWYLQRRPASPRMLRWWPWVIGLAFALCMFGAAAGLNASLNAPPVIGETVAEPPMAQLGTMAKVGAHLVVATGVVWLVILTVQTFTMPPPEDEPGDPAPSA